MKKHSNNSVAILKMDEKNMNLLLEVEYLMESIQSGDLHVEIGYEKLIHLVNEHQEVPMKL